MPWIPATRGWRAQLECGACVTSPVVSQRTAPGVVLKWSGCEASPSLARRLAAGAIWCGTSNARLFRLAPNGASFSQVDLRLPDPTVTALLVDRRGTLWVGSPQGLYSREADGTIRAYTAANGLPNEYIMALLED